MLIALLWWIAGIAGSYLFWRMAELAEARLHQRNAEWCPSPRALIISMAAAVAGPLVLAAAMVTQSLVDDDADVSRQGWLSRPLLRSRKPRKPNKHLH